MTSLTPSRPSADRSLMIVGALAALAVAMILLGIIYGFAAGGWGAGFGHWIYATDRGTVLRYILESLVLLVGVLISTAHPHLRRAQGLGGGAIAARAQRRRPLGHAAAVRRLPQIHPEGADHPLRRQQGRVPARASGRRRAGDGLLGGDPGRTAGWSATSTSAFSTCSRSPRSASTASSWRAGRRTRNTRSSRRCARPRRW